MRTREGTDFPPAGERAGERADAAAGAPADAGRGRRRRAPRRGRRRGAQEWEERLIAGVPARIMRPRLVFISCLGVLLAFGLLMVYSASSVEALSEEGSSTYYLLRQAAFIALGLLCFAAICARNLLGVATWRLFRSKALWAFWWVCVILLVLVPAVGSASGGATRWIVVGRFTLQPSELAKPAIILVVADLLGSFYEDRSLDTGSFVVLLVIAVVVPLALIAFEPDMGTMVIIALTVFAMLYLAGISYKLVLMVLGGLAVVAVLLVIQKPYRLTRILVALDPWSDPYGSGYQATLAIMAFASGGLFGRGIGNSTMKYNYLPEAHNDYILAIIGEEVGLVGTVIFLVVYIAMIVAAFRIALRAPTLHAQLLASGCAFILGLQAFINILGILSVIPMTGKTLPFISYGGSSMVASLIMAGIIFRVSLESDVPTEYDARRAEFSVMSEQDAVSSHLGRSTAGTPHLRSAADSVRRSDFSVVDGGARGAQQGPGDRGAPPRREPPSGGYQRVDLTDASAADRLRPRGATGSGGARSEGARSDRRDDHDR